LVWDELHGPWLMRLPDHFVAALARMRGTGQVILAERLPLILQRLADLPRRRAAIRDASR